MSENSSFTKKMKEEQIKGIGRYFDGIRFLWNTPETRFFLNLILILISSQVVFFIINFFLLEYFSGNLIISIITINSLYFYMGFFLFVLLELFFFYLNVRKYPVNPEKVKLLSMKYFPSQKSHRGKFLYHSILLILSFGVAALVDLLDLFFFRIIIGNPVFLFSIFFLSFIPILYGIIFIVSFLAVKGSMESFADNYLDKFRERKSYIALAYPIPFVLTFILYFFPRIDVLLFDLSAFFLFVYIFISFLGIIFIIKRNWRISYSVSSFSASYTLLFSIIIPFYIGTFIDLFGVFISFSALCFFFIQGTLEAKGDELREYYSAWDEKLNKFNIQSQEDLNDENKRTQFLKSPMDTKVEKAYSKTMLNLMLITVLMFGMFFQIMSTFLMLDPSSSVTLISLFLDLFSFLEFLGLITGTIIFIILIVWREAKKLSHNEEGEKNTIRCPSCNQMTAVKNYCENCGQKLKSS